MFFIEQEAMLFNDQEKLKKLSRNEEKHYFNIRIKNNIWKLKNITTLLSTK